MFNLLNVEAGFTNIFGSMSLFLPQEQRDRKHYPRRTRHRALIQPKFIKPYFETDSINIEIHMHDFTSEFSSLQPPNSPAKQDKTIWELFMNYKATAADGETRSASEHLAQKYLWRSNVVSFSSIRVLFFNAMYIIYVCLGSSSMCGDGREERRG